MYSIHLFLSSDFCHIPTVFYLFYRLYSQAFALKSPESSP